MGECKLPALRVGFDRRPKLEFYGSDISSDPGLLPYRELDDALELTELGGAVRSETRRGKNIRHLFVGLLWQSVFGQLAGHPATDRWSAAEASTDMTPHVIDGAGLNRRAPGSRHLPNGRLLAPDGALTCSRMHRAAQSKSRAQVGSPSLRSKPQWDTVFGAWEE